MPGKRENRRPNPRPAPTFAILILVIIEGKILYLLAFTYHITDKLGHANSKL